MPSALLRHPVLQLDDVSLGVGDIYKRYLARARDLCRDPLPHEASSCSDDLSLCSFDIIDSKSDVGEPRPVGGWLWSVSLVVVLKYFEGWAFVAKTWESKVNAVDFGTRDSCAPLEPLPGEIPFGRYGDTPKDTFVEVSEPFPVFCNEVRVCKLRADRHAPSRAANGD